MQYDEWPFYDDTTRFWRILIWMCRPIINAFFMFLMFCVRCNPRCITMHVFNNMNVLFCNFGYLCKLLLILRRLPLLIPYYYSLNNFLKTYTEIFQTDSSWNSKIYLVCTNTLRKYWTSLIKILFFFATIQVFLPVVDVYG